MVAYTDWLGEAFRDPKAARHNIIPERPATPAILESDPFDWHASTLFLALEAALHAGFAVECVPDPRFGYVARARAAIADVRRPATLRVKPFEIHRPDPRDALAQLLQALTSELAIDALEREEAGAGE